MSYKALARQYRPRHFQEFVGQEHVVKALQNAFKQERLHHAYLFTGTRGVGKTTLARILAKCFNCENGITATPCGQCASCQEIDINRSIDVIEIDAASNTKVEDTRELLDNVAYATHRDRFKIYLIDEVHMLSNHSFNALLKTLEEPPEHVKFILATTDPQKLPVTILSRCLQFNLRHLPVDTICQHLQIICERENLRAEKTALLCLAASAEGSMRDALSLLDQAIAYCAENIDETNVRQMLGHVDGQALMQLVQALIAQNPQSVYESIRELAMQGTDFSQALEDLLSLLHKLALLQKVPTALPEYEREKEELLNLAQRISAADLQLYYQIALTGRQDLAWAPSPRSGFEMLLLRMLEFAPFEAPLSSVIGKSQTPNPPAPIANSMKTMQQAPVDAEPVSVQKKTEPTAIDQNWCQWIQHLKLSGLTLALAQQCNLRSLTDKECVLELSPAHAALASEKPREQLQQALQTYFNRPVMLKIEVCPLSQASPADLKIKAQNEALALAKQKLQADPHLQDCINTFGAVLDETSIQPK